jgi:hypothetical protein
MVLLLLLMLMKLFGRLGFLSAMIASLPPGQRSGSVNVTTRLIVTRIVPVVRDSKWSCHARDSDDRR